MTWSWSAPPPAATRVIENGRITVFKGEWTDRVLEEADSAVATRLTETSEFAEAVSTDPATGSARYYVRLIEGDRWGSSGYYSREMLERDGPRVFAEGTQMFIDHPGETERMDRPERSIRDLAGTISSTPRYESDGLYSEVTFFPHVVPVVEALKDSIGLSIRASGTSEYGEAAGREGQIITELTEGISVDLVTRAGAGGRIVSLLESARPDRVAQRAVRRGVAEATANDIRDALDNLVKGAYGDEAEYVWVRDFDASTVWFEDSAGLWQQTYSGDALTGTRTEVRVVTTYVPVSQTSTPTPPVIPAGQFNPHRVPKGTTMEIDEADYRRIESDAGRVPTLESERDAARAELAAVQAREAARPIVAGIVAESESLTGARTQARVVESVLASVPVTDDGALDEAALRTVAEAARTAAEAEVAEYAASTESATGTVRGFGESARTPEQTEARERSESARRRAFGHPATEQKGA